MAERRSIADKLGWPDGVQTAVFVLALCIMLSPYLGAVEIGDIKIPAVPNARLKRVAEVGGVILFLIVCRLLVPVELRIRIKHIKTTDDADFDSAMELYHDRIPDGIPGADIARWVRLSARENVLLAAKIESKLEGVVLFHTSKNPRTAFLAYLVVRRQQQTRVSDVLMKRVLAKIHKNARILFEVARPIRTQKDDRSRSKLTLEPMSRIEVFDELAARKGMVLRAFDIDYVEPDFSCNPAGERKMILMHLVKRSSGSYDVPKSTVCSVLEFVYMRLYPEDYSDDQQAQAAFEDYCKDLFNRRVSMLSDPVKTFACRTIRDDALKPLV
jgi:hypothetical protein